MKLANSTIISFITALIIISLPEGYLKNKSLKWYLVILGLGILIEFLLPAIGLAQYLEIPGFFSQLVMTFFVSKFLSKKLNRFMSLILGLISGVIWTLLLYSLVGTIFNL